MYVCTLRYFCCHKALGIFCVPFFVEIMFPEKIDSIVSLVIIFIVDILETVRVRFILFSFESR